MARLPTFLAIAEGKFGVITAKTAAVAVRYLPERVLGVVDSTSPARTVQEVLGYGGAIPVVPTFEEGLALGPEAILIGIAPPGGRLPDRWRGWIEQAIDRRLEIWSGLHTFLTDDPELAARARERGARLFDLRRPPDDLPVSTGAARRVDAHVCLAVGTDCNSGKMTAMWELVRGLADTGLRTRFVPTGQTGILLGGWGIAIDAVVADYIGGASERLVLEGAKDADLLLVEGQGSLVHPGYSGVTLGQLHGTCPSSMLLCHQASRRLIGEYHGASAWLAIPPLPRVVRLYEEAASWVHPSKVVGVALNTYDLPEPAARDAIRRAEDETGLPAADPVRFDRTPLVDAIASAARATPRPAA
jgi:uncharacterized NAD-dependent epimerase/dehydratase family protein